MISKKLFQALAALIALMAVGFAGTAHAQSCGVRGSASAAPVVYDPFNPTGLASTTITMTLVRVNTSGGGDTRLVNMYLRASPLNGTGADGTQIVPLTSSTTGSTTGFGTNIFYNYNATQPPLSVISPSSNLPTSAYPFFHIDFTGNNSGSDTATVQFRVTLPPNLNVNAIQQLAFDAYFACNIQGGKQNGLEDHGSFDNAVVFPVTVLSALRTYYAGTALDFGEIGAITTASLGTTPKVTTDASNYIFVQSSGAYSVAVTSANGYKLKRPGATTTFDEVKYQLLFLGQHPDANSPAFTTQNCARAGMASAGEHLPIQAKLIEGGAGKTPSPTYNDTLTVTVTPLVYGFVAPTTCSSL